MLKTCLISLLFLMAQPVAAAPSLNLRSDLDNTSTLQTLAIDQSNITFDTQLGAKGTAIVIWRATVQENPSGASFTIKRSVIGGTAKEPIQAGVRLFAEDGTGAVPFTPNSKFISGAKLTDISTTEDNLGSTVGNGVSRFRLRLDLDTRAYEGTGSVNTTLFIVGALNP